MMDEWTSFLRRWRERGLIVLGPLRCPAGPTERRCERLRGHRGEHAWGLGTCVVIRWSDQAPADGTPGS